MGLFSASIQLVFYPIDTAQIGDEMLAAFETSGFKIEKTPDNRIDYIELISMVGKNNDDIDEHVLADKFIAIASVLKNLPNTLRDYIKLNDLYILIGGWSSNDDQITNLIIPHEFSLETSALKLRYEFCLNDYHQ